jgi:ornithine cyclodeaminase
MIDPSGPVVIDLPHTRASLSFARLVPALRAAFIAGANAPLRHSHPLEQPGTATATLLLMPAWQGRSALGVKIVTVFPDNGALGLNAVFSTYLLCDGATGRHLALIDGNEITGRRTAAASALAGDFLARDDANTLLIVGAGHIAAMLAPAWAAVRPIRHVRVWNARPARATALAAGLCEQGFDAAATDDLQAAVGRADIVSCATLATAPLVHGAWLRPGTHLDLIGGFRPDMREADDEAVRRACVFIDTEAALAEAGDLAQPLAAGVLRRDQIAGSLFTLCRGETPGRRTGDEITLFKSVGSALEDLATAALVWQDRQQQAAMVDGCALSVH